MGAKPAKGGTRLSNPALRKTKDPEPIMRVLSDPKPTAIVMARGLLIMRLMVFHPDKAAARFLPRGHIFPGCKPALGFRFMTHSVRRTRMRAGFGRRFCGCVLALLFWGTGGCATPKYQANPAHPGVVADTKAQLQKEAIIQTLARQERLLHLTWPLMAENTVFCRKLRPDLGMVIGDLKVIEGYVPKLTRAQIAKAGYADYAHVLYVMPGSPAAAAGLRKGDRLLVVGDDTSGGPPTARQAARAIKKRLEAKGKVTLVVQSDDGTASRSLHPEGQNVCDVNVILSPANTINAFAARDNIVMHEGMLRLLDDAGVQFVMAHELAHQAGRHQRKWIYNALVSGGFVYGPILVAGGEVIDAARRAIGQKPKISLAGKAIARIGSGTGIFEAEADYLGLYMLARAGGDLSGAEKTFAFLAREKPSSTWIRYTHPLTPERIAAARLAGEEIAAKRAAGEELLPAQR